MCRKPTAFCGWRDQAWCQNTSPVYPNDQTRFKPGIRPWIRFGGSRDASRSVRECYSRTTVDMDVTLRLRNFKGYGLNGTERGAKILHLYIRTIKQDTNLVFDLGLGLMAHAMRAGAFGSVTLEDLWASKSTKISVGAPFLNCPIFRSLASRGFGLETAPLRWSSAATGFRQLFVTRLFSEVSKTR